LLLLHVPLPAASVKVVVAPAQIVELPEIEPAEGNALMVTIFTALVLPQDPVTV
jgi:hypothetical protein